MPRTRSGRSALSALGNGAGNNAGLAGVKKTRAGSSSSGASNRQTLAMLAKAKEVNSGGKRAALGEITNVRNIVTLIS